MKLPPPGLPLPLVDENTEILDKTLQTRWDVLASTALDEFGSVICWDRRKVVWKRNTLTHWCCWHPMRIGQIYYQPKGHQFGWLKYWRKFIGCQICGYLRTSRL